MAERESGTGRTIARVQAQAKLNLFLRVLAREASGYHQIETLFCRLDLADDVTVRVGGSDRNVTTTGADVGPPEVNLAYRAASMYADETGWPSGFSISIDKRIPVAAGLGGGSADAGAVLRALNALAPEPIFHSQLLHLAVRLGADVPFLAAAVPLALAWGRGERMLAIAPLPARDVTLLCPPFGVATEEAYGAIARSRLPAEPTPIVHGSADLGTWEALAQLSVNDFEPVVGARYPQLRRVLHLLHDRDVARLSRMSGSGSTIFVVGKLLTEERARLREVARDWRIIDTRTATRVVGIAFGE